MPWSVPRPRFGLRTLLLLVLASALALGWWTSGSRWRTYQNQQARARIDPYELKIAGDGSPHNVPAELVAILGDSRLRHWFQTGGMKLLPGDQGISLGGDQIARVWDINTGRQTRSFAGEAITVNQPRDRVFLGSADGMVTCYDTTSWKALKTFDLKTQFDRLSMAVSGDGSVLVTQPIQADGNREILIWDTATATVRHRFQPKGIGGVLLVNGDGSLFAWDEDQQIKVSRTDTGEVVRTMGPVMSGSSRCFISELALTADESKLIVSSACRNLIALDWLTGQEIQRFPEGTSGHPPFAQHPGRKQLAIGIDQDLSIFVETKEGWRFLHRSADKLYCSKGIDWFGDQLSGFEELRLDEHRLVLRSSAQSPFRPQRVMHGPIRAVSHLAFHPDGKRLFVAKTSGQVVIHQVGTWQLEREWSAHEQPIIGLTLAANGSKLATAARDGIAVWDTATGGETCVVRDTWRNELIGLSPDGAQLATALQAGLGQGVEIWDTISGQSIGKIQPTPSVWSSPIWSPDAAHLVCNDMSSTLHLFDVKGQTVLAPLGTSRLAQMQLQTKWFADSQRIVTVGWGRDEIHILQIGKTKPIKTIHGGAGRLQCLDLDGSNEWLAVAGHKTPVQIWHLPTGTLVKSWQIGPLEGQVTQVAFSPDGHYLATVNGNGTAYVLNLDGVLP